MVANKQSSFVYLKASFGICLVCTEIRVQTSEKHLVNCGSWQRDPSSTEKDPTEYKEPIITFGSEDRYGYNPGSDGYKRAQTGNNHILEQLNTDGTSNLKLNLGF